MMRNFPRLRVALVTGVALLAVWPVRGADDNDLTAVRAQLTALEQQVRVLARQIELTDDAARAAAAAVPKVTATDRGFALASADNANAIRLRGLAQLDARFYFGNHGSAGDTLVLRRARIILDGTFDRSFSFQLVPEFGGSNVSLLDANVGLRLDNAIGLTVGKFKSPVGLELLQSDAWTFFNERSIVSNLVPNRDLGVQVSGALLGGIVKYEAAVLAGVADGASSNNTDTDSDKDFTGRVILTRSKARSGSPLHGLSLGIGGSIGRHKTVVGRSTGYKSDGQQTFFAYTGAVVADGVAWRLAPQLDYRAGPVGLVGEYVISAATLRPNSTGPKAELRHSGGELSAGYVVTGEDSSYTGVRPRSPFNWANGTWGAFEVVGRYAEVRIDDAAFPLFAAPTTNPDCARACGVGLTWYLSNTVVIKTDFYRTRFGFNAVVRTAAVLRQDENSLITRFQVSF